MLVSHSQSSLCIRQISFLFTNRSTSLLFCNPSDELWMLPELIFIKSVMKKNWIFSLPLFHRSATRKMWSEHFYIQLLSKAKFPSPHSLFPPTPEAAVELLSSVPKMLNQADWYQREGLRTSTRETLCLGVKTEGEDALPGVIKRGFSAETAQQAEEEYIWFTHFTSGIPMLRSQLYPSM